MHEIKQKYVYTVIHLKKWLSKKKSLELYKLYSNTITNNLNFINIDVN